MSDADPYGSNGHDVAHVDSNDGHLVLDPRQYAIEYARGYAESCAREVQRNMADESNQATYDEYLIDVRRHMESMEVGHLRFFSPPPFCHWPTIEPVHYRSPSPLPFAGWRPTVDETISCD